MKILKQLHLLNQLVTFLTEERSRGDEAIKQILLWTHPAFEAIKSAAKVQYRVVFLTLKELDALLSARGFAQDISPEGDWYDWDNYKSEYGIRVDRSIFEPDGSLKVITPQQWDDEWVSTYAVRKQLEEDDIPF